MVNISLSLPRFPSAQRTPLLASALLLCAGSLAAQTVPDAGTLRQQLETERHPTLPAPAPRAPDKPAAPSTPAQGPQVVVQAFLFEGNTLFLSETLAELVKRWLHRPVRLAELQEAAAAVAAHYRAQGWVVDVQLPAQDITQGEVRLQIREGRMGEVRADAPLSLRFDRQIITKRLARKYPKGQALNTQNLDRDLLVLDDLPGINVSGQLAPGQSPNSTNLVLRMSDEPQYHGDASLDNQGSRSTGTTRQSVNLAINSPTGTGDLLSATLLHTEGSNYVRLAYSLPVGDDGWRMGVNVSRLGYKLIGSEFAALLAQGNSTSTGLEASYPVVRSRRANLGLHVAADSKQYDNQANQTTSSHYQNQSLSVNLNGNLFDDLGGGGANSASVSVNLGRIDLGTLNAGENAQQDGTYQKLRYGISRQQALNKTLSLYFAYSGQWATRTLDSSEKLYLGGANGVRAYPGSEAGGSEGQLANLELRWQVAPGGDLTGFYDWGSVRQQLDGDTPTNSYHLAGYGLSLGWMLPNNMALKLTWARRKGSNPNPTNNGNDQDGSLMLNRFWLSAALPF